jgi:hypothetical protein
LLDVIVDNFFLGDCQAIFEIALGLGAYLVAQPHDSAGWCHCDEPARDESLNASPFRRIGQRNLVLLLC